VLSAFGSSLPSRVLRRRTALTFGADSDSLRQLWRQPPGCVGGILTAKRGWFPSRRAASSLSERLNHNARQIGVTSVNAVGRRLEW
jgi:hypothetical protein